MFRSIVDETLFWLWDSRKKMKGKEKKEKKVRGEIKVKENSTTGGKVPLSFSQVQRFQFLHELQAWLHFIKSLSAVAKSMFS